MCRPCALSRVWPQVSCILHVKVACNVIQWNRFYTDCLETGVLVDPALPDNSDLRRVMDSGSIKKIERGQALPKITTPPGESDCPWLTRPGQLDHSVCPGKDHLILVLSCTNKSLTSKPSDLIQQEGEGELAPREGVKNALHEHLTVAQIQELNHMSLSVTLGWGQQNTPFLRTLLGYWEVIECECLLSRCSGGCCLVLESSNQKRVLTVCLIFPDRRLAKN